MPSRVPKFGPQVSIFGLSGRQPESLDAVAGEVFAPAGIGMRFSSRGPIGSLGKRNLLYSKAWPALVLIA